jgi:proteasome lid subunit RPN8/RPN11
MITLPAQWQDAIRAEGEKAYPHECCGVLLGAIYDDDSRMVENIIPINNAREREEQYHRFKIEPEDLMRAQKEARAQNREVLGFYHSHPDHPARPSEYDRNNAFPFYSYIIVSVEKSKAAALTSWRLTDDRKNFLKEEIDYGNNHSNSNSAAGVYGTQTGS